MATALTPARRTFWRLADAWRRTTADQFPLLGLARTNGCQWRRGVVGPLDRPVLGRLSSQLGIGGALPILRPVPERTNVWIRKPDPAPRLASSSPQGRLTRGQVADLVVSRLSLVPPADRVTG